MPQTLKPDKIIAQFPEIFKPGASIADFGCGIGYFTLAFAKSVSNHGRVFAIDILPSALNLISSQAKHQGIFNIQTIRGDLEKARGSALKDAQVDVVFAANLFFQVEKKETVFKEAFRILRPGGYLMIIEWAPESFLGPPPATRPSSKDLRSLAEASGFKLERDFKPSQTHFGLLFKKP